MSKPMVVDLVFEGGGMKGIALVGALRALAEQNYQPGRLLGSSIGSMVATLLAAGYSAQELLGLIVDPTTGELVLKNHIKPFSAFTPVQIEASATLSFLKDVNLPVLPDFLEGGVDGWLAKSLMGNTFLQGFFMFLEKAGTHDPEPFVRWLESLLGEKLAAQTETLMGDLTLAQLHQITGHHLSLLAANVTNPTMLILNHNTAPDCPVVQAVRMATAAPGLFPPAAWQTEWGAYRNREMTGELIMNGGVISNFPIELFLSQDEMVTSILGKPDDNAGVLGLLLDESLAVPGAPQTPPNTLQQSLSELPGISLLTQLIRTTIEARDKRAMELAPELVVRLPVGGYAPFVFNLTPDQLQPLVNASHNAMLLHLEKYQPSARSLNQIVQLQVDKAAKHIINVYGNMITVNQDIGEVKESGTVVGVKIGAGEQVNQIN